MENTGDADAPWIEHLTTQAPDTDPYIRGTLAYKCADLNKDGYPEVVHNAMFDVANSDPPQFRGEIWLAVNPGPTVGMSVGRRSSSTTTTGRRPICGSTTSTGTRIRT